MAPLGVKGRVSGGPGVKGRVRGAFGVEGLEGLKGRGGKQSSKPHPPIPIGHEMFLGNARLDEVVIEFKFEPELIMKGFDQERSLMIMLRGLQLMETP